MGVIREIIERLRWMLITVQDFSLFTASVVGASVTRPFYGKEMVHQLHFAAIGSLLIVVISSAVRPS